jgi:hypothetical protein
LSVLIGDRGAEADRFQVGRTGFVEPAAEVDRAGGRGHECREHIGRGRVHGEHVGSAVDARVVDDGVEAAEPLGLLGGRDGLVEPGEVPVDDAVHGGRREAAAAVADVGHDVMPAARQRLGGREPESGGRAGDQDERHEAQP